MSLLLLGHQVGIGPEDTCLLVRVPPPLSKMTRKHVSLCLSTQVFGYLECNVTEEEKGHIAIMS